MKEGDLTDMRCGDGFFSLPESDSAFPYCRQHDLDYIEGGTDEDRIAADENFRKNLEFSAKTKNGGLWSITESVLLPFLVGCCGRFFWKPYSRLSDYLRQGREKGGR